MIDWTRVRDLKDEIGEEDFADVAQMFIAEVEEVIERLKKSPNPQTFEHDFHFLKSSALNLGFSDFAAMCQGAEQQSAAGSAEFVDLASLFSTYERSKSAFLGNQP